MEIESPLGAWALEPVVVLGIVVAGLLYWWGVR